MFDVCVQGLGYIGLPTAAMFANAGLRVLGVDVNAARLAALADPNWESPERGLAALVQSQVNDQRLTLSMQLAHARTFIIAVPTPVTKEYVPDLSYVKSAAEALLPFLTPGVLVVLESTVAPGTTDDVVLPILLRSGLMLDEELFVAHAPERVLPGNLIAELVSNDRVVGGVTARSAEKAAKLYEVITRGEITCSGAATAEAAKLMENTYRDINIAIANEFALVAEHLAIDVWEVIALANRHPRVNILQPGPGVGGHCLAVDPYYLAAAAPGLTPLTLIARAVNDGMAEHVAALAARFLPNTGGRVAVAGLAYKADVADARETPSRPIVATLLGMGYEVRVSDPFIEDAGNLSPYFVDVEEALRGTDLLLMLTGHTPYRNLDPEDVGRLMRNRVLVDVRNCVDHERWRSAGFRVAVLGAATEQPRPAVVVRIV